jgi:YD repeat-containing protein
MKRLFLFLLIFNVFWISAGYGQNDDYKEQQRFNKIVPVSPNAASLGIFGSIPVGHYTGVPNISIPLYEIKSGDVTIPITLSYHASGIKVAQEASSVGLGWALNAGGCIVREIKHLDDFIGQGYYVDQDFPESDENNNSVNANASDNISNYRDGYLANTKDSEPDIFRYNFGNMLGSFFFERDIENGTDANIDSLGVEAIITNKNTYLKIVCRRIHNPMYNLNFEITDAYGNTYYFSSNERTRTIVNVLNGPPQEQYLNRNHFESNDVDEEVITAWYLDKMITSRRDTIAFEYEKERIYSPVRVSEDVSYVLDINSYSAGTSDAILYPETFGPYKYYFKSYTVTEQLLLKKITFKGGYIKLDYLDDRKDIEYANHTDPNKHTKRLNYLTVEDGSNTIVKKVQFNHSYLGNIIEDTQTLNDKMQNALNCRLLLDGIDVISLGNGTVDQQYVFDYNNNPLPSKNSRYTDYWGYYTEDSELNSNQDFHYTPSFKANYLNLDGIACSTLYSGINKNPSIVRSQYGMLTSIQYPTGGRTNYEYELHNFSNAFEDGVDSLVESGGGLRIKKIYDLSNSVDTTSVKSFIYYTNGESSGLLMTVPNHHYFFILDHIVQQIQRTLIGISNYIALYANGASNPISPIVGSASGMYVGYSYVEERNITDGINNGYTVYEFRNKANRIIDMSDRQIRNYPSIPYLDNGLPINITYFDNDNNTVKSTNFEYRQAEIDSIKGLMVYQLPMVNMNFNTKFYDVYSERWVMDEKSETQFFPGNKSLTLTTEYGYDSSNWQKNYERTLIDGDLFETDIRYPNDYGSSLSGMIENNMIGVPIEIIKHKNGDIISANKTTFWHFNGMYLPEFYYEWDTGSENYNKQFTIDRYDTYGNILQIISKDNIPTTYLWSYNNTYPVAEIKNATYSQIETILGSSLISRISSDNTPDQTDLDELDGLRDILPEAKITTYTYKPLVGVTSITDPSGRTTRYQYDAFNRLSAIRDDQGNNGNLIQQFEYNYKVQ